MSTWQMLIQLTVVAAAATLLFHRSVAERIIEAINRFRGGPRTPMHPSPAGDTAFLRKRQKTVRF